MFKQIKNLDGDEIYLIASLLIFLVFFILITIYLIRLNKQHVTIMSNKPIGDQKVHENEEN